MKTTVILFLLHTIFPHVLCLAKNTESADVYLTNYIISKESNAVGFVKVTSGEIKSIKLDGKHAQAFGVTKDNQLIVHREKLQEGWNTFDIILTVKTSSGKLSKAFTIVKDDFIRNKVIAHRGAWKNTGVPENSIAALNHAIIMGCEGSEFDVHMSADSVPFIHHDATIRDVSIAKTNSKDLQTMKLTSGEYLPTLEVYLKAGTMQTKTRLILEIKPSELGKESSIALTHKVVALVEKLGAQAWVDYISFDYEVCREVMQLAPYARVAYLKGDKSPGELAADKFFGLDYHFSVLQKNPDWIEDAKRKKLTINVWTVNDRPMLEELLNQNVDFITTNEPELLLSLER